MMHMPSWQTTNARGPRVLTRQFRACPAEAWAAPSGFGRLRQAYFIGQVRTPRRL